MDGISITDDLAGLLSVFTGNLSDLIGVGGSIFLIVAGVWASALAWRKFKASTDRV